MSSAGSPFVRARTPRTGTAPETRALADENQDEEDELAWQELPPNPDDRCYQDTSDPAISAARAVDQGSEPDESPVQPADGEAEPRPTTCSQSPDPGPFGNRMEEDGADEGGLEASNYEPYMCEGSGSEMQISPKRLLRMIDPEGSDCVLLNFEEDSS